MNGNVSHAGPALRACVSCRKYKRRCDKILPSCGLCLRSNRDCDYHDYPQSSHLDEISDLRSRIRKLEQRLLPPFDLTNLTPSASSTSEPFNRALSVRHSPYDDISTLASYMDSEVWLSCNFPIDTRPIAAQEEFASLFNGLAEIDQIMSQYYLSIHTWMPIVSKIRLNRLTKHAQGPLQADVVLLLLCMRLVATQEEQPRLSTLYAYAKNISKEVELKGLITLRTIQAGILLSVYEVGHGIYPAAFSTISCCARQGVALGIHNKLAPQRAGNPRSWVDWEERQRVWWMIVILDRYIAIGTNYQPLCTEDPSGDTLLPASDIAWDDGEMACSERVSLSSQDSTSLSSFARMAQASNLLGRVIRHCNDPSMERAFVLDDFQMLCRTIRSFLQLLEMNNDSAPKELNNATAIAYSALFKLASHHSCDMYDEENQNLIPDMARRVRECTQDSLQITKDACDWVLSGIRGSPQMVARPMMEKASPLILHCIYSCASNLSYAAFETGNPRYTEGKIVCEDLLRSMSARWEAADVYMTLRRIADLAQDEGS